MTTNKAQKRAIRTRMAKTGERYAAARHHLLNRHRAANDAEPSTAGLAAIGDEGLPPATPTETATSATVPEDRVALAAADEAPGPEPAASPPAAAPDAGPGPSEAAVRRATGKCWDEWFALLDAWGAADECHRAIARHLERDHGLDGWWAQSVTVGYERARGRRALHQTADGFEISVSRTFPLPLERLRAAFAEEAARDRWLEPGTLRRRPGRAHTSLRFDVGDGATRLTVTLTAKGGDRTVAALQHERLPGAIAVETWRAFWKERLARLADVLANGAAGPGRPGQDHGTR